MLAMARKEFFIINGLFCRGRVIPRSEQRVDSPVRFRVEALSCACSAEFIKLHPFDSTKRKPREAHLHKRPKALAAG